MRTRFLEGGVQLGAFGSISSVYHDNGYLLLLTISLRAEHSKSLAVRCNLMRTTPPGPISKMDL